MATLGNTVHAQTVFLLEQRKSYAFGLRFIDARTNLAIDLTGASLRMVVQEQLGTATAIDQDAEFVDAEMGLAQINLQASQLDLPEGEHNFSVTLVSLLGYSTVVLKGVIDIQPNTESESTLVTFPGINPSTNVAVYLEQGDLVNVTIDNLDGMSAIAIEMIQSFEAETDAKLAAWQAQADALFAPATTVTAGIVRLTTEAEAVAGTADDIAVTPVGLAAALSDFLPPDLTELIQDTVNMMMVSGANVTWTYDDTTGQMTLTAVGGDAEQMRDTIGAAIVGSGGVVVNINDPGDTITITLANVPMSAITGLTAALGDKSDVGHTHAFADLTGGVGLPQLTSGALLIIMWDGSGWVYDGAVITARPTADPKTHFCFVDFIGGAVLPAWALDDTDLALLRVVV